MRSCFLFLAIFVSSHAFAQEGFVPGYLVTNENDTIVGLVKNKNSVPYRILQNIKFKKDKSGDPQTYSPDELKGFQIGSDRYISIKYRKISSTATSFVHVLMDGDMSYYELRRTELGVGNEVIYQMLHKKGDDSLFSVYGINFQERLLAYLAGEPALMEKVKAGTYRRNNVDELVQEYNLMKHSPQQSKTTKRGAVNFYLKTGNKKTDVYLVVNDTLEYRFQEKPFITVSIPTDVKSKVCFGTKENKSCALISKLAYYPLSEYYELKASGDKTKFKIERRSQEDAQLFIAQKMK